MSVRCLAFVAGATGYTGSATIAVLRKRGIETVAHVRPDSGRLGEWCARFEALGARVDTTLWEAAALHATLRELRPTHVFALLGTTLARSRRGSDSSVPDTYERVDRDLTLMLLAASGSAQSLDRFVYVSAAGAKSGTRNPYLRVRVEVENAVRASGLPFTIARPAFVSGSDREEARPLERVGAVTSDMLFSVMARLGACGFTERYRSISSTELAHGIVHAAFDPRSAGRTLHAGQLRATSPASELESST